MNDLVGREREIRRLVSDFERAAAGEGSVVLVRGEAGIGKTRLLAAFVERLGERTFQQARLTGSPHHQGTAYHPVGAYLERTLGVPRDGDDRWDALSDAIERLGLSTDTVLPLFADLLGVPIPDSNRAGAFTSPEQHRRRLRRAFLSTLRAISGEQPLLVIAEDMHFADAATLELVQGIMVQTRVAPALLVVVHRPGFEPTTPEGVASTGLELGRMSRDETTALVRSLSGGDLPAPVLGELLARANGVPLFAEELCNMLVRSGRLRKTPAGWRVATGEAAPSIPATLHESLLARLDLVDEDRDLVRLAATIGREQDEALLGAVAGEQVADLEQRVDRLVGAGVLVRIEEGSIAFRHGLIRKAAYESQPVRERRERHAAIATAIEAGFPDLADREPEVLALHHERAGQPDRAVPLLIRAGDLARQRSAIWEAVDHFERALGILERAPDREERAAAELAVRMRLGACVCATRGYGVPEVEPIFTRAAALCRRVGDDAAVFQAQRGLWSYYLARGDLGQADTFAKALEQTAEATGDAVVRGAAFHSLGVTRFFAGDTRPALGWLERAIAEEDAAGERSIAAYGQDPASVARGYVGWALHALGRAQAAIESLEDARRVAERTGHPFSHAFVLAFTATHWVRVGDAERAMEAARRTIDVAGAHGFAMWLGIGNITLGWARCARGQIYDGLAVLTGGLSGYRATGARIGLPLYDGLHADACRLAGRVDEGRAIVAGAMQDAIDRGERWADRDLERIRGELG